MPESINDCAHAAFFALIGGVDAGLAQQLHGMEERKPFTLCPLHEDTRGIKRQADAPPVPSGLRLTLLDEALFGTVAHALLANAAHSFLRLGDAQFQVMGAWLTPDAHPLAGSVTYAELCRNADMPDTLTARFATPTVFRSQKQDVLWPEPRLAWQSWLRAWMAFAPPNLLSEEAQILDWAAQTTVREPHLQTLRIPLGNIRQAGFMGTCVYDLSALTPEARQTLTMLADFAFYAGTGRKTAMGMGQTQCRPNVRNDRVGKSKTG